jgi:ATP-dependent protease ClpP protease subunit
MNKATLRIEGNIGTPDPRTLDLGLQDKSVSSDMVAEFLAANADADVIEVIIRSNGGSVSQGFDIYDQLINSGKKIITKGYKVNSIATVIFMAGSERYLSKNAEFVIHNPWLGPEQLTGMKLTADELQSVSNEVRSSENKMFDFYSNGLKLKENEKIELNDLMKKDTNLGSAKAIEMGFATGYLESQKQIKAVYTDLILAKYKSNNNKEMNTEVTNKLSKLELLMNKVISLFPTRNVVGLMAVLEDGTKIYHDGELALQLAVFSDEEMTMPVADGEYVFDDGTRIIVTEGLVTDLIMPTASTDEPADEAKKLEETIAANTELTEKNALLEAKIAELTASTESEKTELQAQVLAIKTEFDSMKALVIGDSGIVGSSGAEQKSDTPWSKRIKQDQAIKDLINGN